MTTFNPLKAFQSFLFTEIASPSITRLPQGLDPNRMEGRAIVSDIIEPYLTGRVHFQSSWWPAQCEQEVTLTPGEVVQVVGRRGITLLVEPVPCLETEPDKLLKEGLYNPCPCM